MIVFSLPPLAFGCLLLENETEARCARITHFLALLCFFLNELHILNIIDSFIFTDEPFVPITSVSY